MKKPESMSQRWGRPEGGSSWYLTRRVVLVVRGGLDQEWLPN
jgi:hypothetical protein